MQMVEHRDATSFYLKSISKSEIDAIMFCIVIPGSLSDRNDLCTKQILLCCLVLTVQ